MNWWRYVLQWRPGRRNRALAERNRVLVRRLDVLQTEVASLRREDPDFPGCYW